MHHWKWELILGVEAFVATDIPKTTLPFQHITTDTKVLQITTFCQQVRPLKFHHLQWRSSFYIPHISYNYGRHHSWKGRVHGSPDTHNGTEHIPVLPHQHSDPGGIHPHTALLSYTACILGRPAHEIRSLCRYGTEDDTSDKQPCLPEVLVHPAPVDLPTHSSSHLDMIHFSVDSAPAM